MGIILWIVIALAVVGVLVYVASLRTRQLLPPLEMPPGERIPGTPVQRRAALALLVIGALVFGAAAIVAWFGPLAWWEQDPVRLTVTFILLAALAAFLAFTLSVKALESRDDGSFDERDSVIMSRSCAGVGGAMMVVFAAWMIALTESFRETGLVPSYYLYLAFWSLVMTNVLASVAGILLAYRRG